MATVEQHVRFAPSCFCTGTRHEPLRERDAGGWISLSMVIEFDRESIFVAQSAAGDGDVRST